MLSSTLLTNSSLSICQKLPNMRDLILTSEIFNYERKDVEEVRVLDVILLFGIP